MTAPKLVLHPVTPVTGLSPSAVLEMLRELGLIGAPFRLDGQQHYGTGHGFLDHISFLGCAPCIELEAPASDPETAARAGRFCHIQLSEAGAQPRLRLRPDQRPRCRTCRRDIDPVVFANPAGVGAEIVCPGCGRNTEPMQLLWRQAGGYAALFLDIWGIHTAEAVPGDRLLDSLGRLSRCAWTFFYIED